MASAAQLPPPPAHHVLGPVPQPCPYCLPANPYRLPQDEVRPPADFSFPRTCLFTIAAHASPIAFSSSTTVKFQCQACDPRSRSCWRPAMAKRSASSPRLCKVPTYIDVFMSRFRAKTSNRNCIHIQRAPDRVEELRSSAVSIILQKRDATRAF